ERGATERTVLKDVDASRAIRVDHLRPAPDGLYQLAVEAPSFLPVRQIVNIRSDGITEVEIVLRAREGKGEPPEQVTLVDDRGRPRDNYDPGESLTVGVRGLEADMVYDFTLSDETGKPLLNSSLLANRKGDIEPTLLWPQLGLSDLITGEKFTVPQAQQRWGGRRLRLQVRERGRQVLEHAIPIAEHFTRPLILNTDPGGFVLNGFEVGQHDAVVSAYNVPHRGVSRIYLVPRQHNWFAGDRFQPVTLASGRAGFSDVELAGAESSFTHRVAAAAELMPGAYDYIIRPLRYGYEDDEDFVLRDSDLATRVLTGLVVRWEFMKWKAVLGGCTNTQNISGRKVFGAPYFQYADTFQLGEDVYGALDPAALLPNQKGKMVALYVVKRPVADYSALNHLPQLGGNAAVQKLLTQTDCINHNTRLLWSHANQVGEYDVIADFGNDTADPLAFAPDHSFDQPLDLVDGKLVVGFRVVEDPGIATNPNIPHFGVFEYDQSTQGSINVNDPGGDFGSPVLVNLKAEIRFPADSPGITDPAQISTAQADYPLLVCVHGNGHNYKNYTYLLEHWARNGFIAASIHLNTGMAGEGRASVLFKHLQILKTLFAGHVQNKIGIMGHSRGGEGVVSAARMNQQQALGHGIKAIISLGPTDQYTNETLAAPWATPYLVMHGAMDGDVAYPGFMGFSLYDRAKGEPKSMLWLYGANHNRFNLINPDGDYNTWKIDAVADHPKIMTQASHMATAKAYMTTFFRWQLYGAAEYEGIFKGEWVPASVAQAEPALNRIYVQYGGKVASVVDDFEQMPHNWQVSTVAGSVSDAGTLPAAPQENDLATLDPQSPHDTSGLLLRWNDFGDKLVYTPNAPINAGAFLAVSFRVGQRVGSLENAAGQVQDFYLTLTDVSNKARSIRVDAFGDIPPQQERGVSQFTLTALSTVRIPLHVYQTEVINTNKVDITQIKSISFDFQARAKGELEIDSLEFTN
ncbi:MAG TPA: hypothetical protein VH394_26820, partial [Thermoanaerobaculia bacterium]|nr:hypothetical protein [Thermoanaerobaculia bacterium]